jgi:hypothetical protein
MSYRALRRLREVQQQQQLNLDSEQDNDYLDEDEEEEDTCIREKTPLFDTRLLLSDSDLDSDSDSESICSGGSDESNNDSRACWKNEGDEAIISLQVTGQRHFENKSVGRGRGQKQRKIVDDDWDDDDFQYLITKNTMAESSLQNPTYTNLSTLLIQSMNVTHLDLLVSPNVFIRFRFSGQSLCVTLW